jgi:hypothetical protein
LFSTYRLRTLEELKQDKPQAEDKCEVIEHLTVYNGFYCLQPECEYGTRHARKIRKHMSSVYQIKAAVYNSCVQWSTVKLQTYFTAFGRIDYFVVKENAKANAISKDQLLVYYYRVVYYKGGYFTRTKPDQILPKDVIQPTKQQIQAINKITQALGFEDEEEVMLALKHAVRRLYLALICQTVSSMLFKSPVLSFCAILSRKVRGKGRGLWEEPGNFNSYLSALT